MTLKSLKDSEYVKPLILASAVAWVPLPPLIVTVGVSAKSNPAFVRMISSIFPTKWPISLAFVPEVSATPIWGGFTTLYPTPLLSILTPSNWP